MRIRSLLWSPPHPCSVSSPMIHFLLELWATTRFHNIFFKKKKTQWSPSRNLVNTSIMVLRSHLTGISSSSGTGTPSKRHYLFFAGRVPRSGLSSAGWRAEYRRQPRDGRATLCAITLHINSESAKRQCIAFNFMRMITAVMVQHQVDVVAGNCNGCWRPSSGVGCGFASTPLLLTLGCSPLWERCLSTVSTSSSSPPGQSSVYTTTLITSANSSLVFPRCFLWPTVSSSVDLQLENKNQNPMLGAPTSKFARLPSGASMRTTSGFEREQF